MQKVKRRGSSTADLDSIATGPIVLQIDSFSRADFPVSPQVVIPKHPQYVPRVQSHRRMNVHNTTLLPGKDTLKCSILSRKGEGKDIIFTLGHCSDQGTPAQVKECALSDIHNFVSLQDLNDFENRIYEEEYQEELDPEKNIKKRGRPVLISTGSEPLVKVKGPRGRPRKTPLQPPPVESTATSDGETNDASSETSESEENSDTERISETLVKIPSISAPSFKRKRPEIEVPLKSSVINPPSVSAAESVSAITDGSELTSHVASPDEPTEWERTMMEMFGPDQPARGTLRPSRGRPKGSTSHRTPARRPAKMASVPPKRAPMSPIVVMRPKAGLLPNGVLRRRIDTPAMETSPSRSEDELASSPAPPSDPQPQHAHSSDVHTTTKTLEEASDNSSHSESESSAADSSDAEIVSPPRPPEMKYGEAILAARKCSLPPLVRRSRVAERSRSRPSGSLVPIPDRKQGAIIDISQLDAGQAGVGSSVAKSSIIAKKKTSAGMMTKKRRTSTTPLFPAAASPPKRRVLEVRDVRS